MIAHIYYLYEVFKLGPHLTATLVTLTIVAGIIVSGIIFHKTLHRTLSQRFHVFIRHRYPEIESIASETPILEHFLMLLIPVLLFLIFLPLLVSTEDKILIQTMHAIEKILITYILFLLGVLTNTLINAIELAYKKRSGTEKWPIRSYVQFVKGFTFIVFTILIISHLLDKSPLTFLTGLGAAMAIITLVFKDSILSFVSSIQLATSNMMQKGDWIEIPEKNISGNIIEMSLNTIKIQNFDNTISTLPPYYLTSNAIKNWRGMFESGARQMKISFTLDGNTIKFADTSLLSKLSKIPSLTTYIAPYQEKGSQARITNLGLLRYYIENFIEEDDRFKKKNCVFMARIIQPSYVGGVPLEIYTYTKETNVKNHEHIQADLIEHVIAIMPQFDLKLLQEY